MVAPGSVWASVCDLFLYLVLVETQTGVVAATADSSYGLSLAFGLVVAEETAREAMKWFGGVGAIVVSLPVAQGQVKGKRASKCD